MNFVDPSGRFAIAGAVIGGGIDLGVRLYVSNDRMATVQDWKTWASVGVSAALGATGAGLGEVSGNAAATFTASSLGQFATRTILNAAGSAALGAAGTAMNNAISRENASLKNSIMLNGILGGAGSILADGIRASVNSVAIKSWNNASLTDKLMMTILEPVKIGYSIESVTIGLGNIAGETVGNSAPIFENK